MTTLLSIINLFLDVQTAFNWSCLSSQSKEFRGGFFIDSYTKVQLLPWRRIFFFFFSSLGFTQLFKSFQAGFSSIVTRFDAASELNTGFWGSSVWGAIVVQWDRGWTSCWKNGHGTAHAAPKHSHMHTQHSAAQKRK